MSDPNVQELGLGARILRIHSVVTRALDVSIEHAESLERDGLPDNASRTGFATHVRCLAILLRSHHLNEDEFVFPELSDKMPDIPLAST